MFLSSFLNLKYFNVVSDVFRNKKNCYKYQRSIRDYPFKKRRLYQLDSPFNSDNRSGSVEDNSGLDATAQDSHGN